MYFYKVFSIKKLPVKSSLEEIVTKIISIIKISLHRVYSEIWPFLILENFALFENAL